MKKFALIFRWPAAALALGCLQPASAWACSACYGQSDSPMANGLNWGILTLLGVVVTVLAGTAGFFVYLAKKSASAAAQSAPPPPSA